MVEYKLEDLNWLSNIKGNEVKVVKSKNHGRDWQLGEEFVVTKVNFTPYGIFLYKNDAQNIDWSRVEKVEPTK